MYIGRLQRILGDDSIDILGIYIREFLTIPFEHLITDLQLPAIIRYTARCHFGDLGNHLLILVANSTLNLQA